MSLLIAYDIRVKEIEGAASWNFLEYIKAKFPLDLSSPSLSLSINSSIQDKDSKYFKLLRAVNYIHHEHYP